MATTTGLFLILNEVSMWHGVKLIILKFILYQVLSFLTFYQMTVTEAGVCRYTDQKPKYPLSKFSSVLVETFKNL